MKPLLALCFAATLLQAGTPLAVVRAVREGEPPFEDGQLFYRLEGDGSAALKPGEVLRLVRPRDARPMALLEVVDGRPGYVLARIRQPGATFPLRGDLAIPREPLRTPPPLPDPGQPLPAAPAAAPAAPALAVPPPLAVHREPIYFLADEAALTPGAKAKLKGWVASWGHGGVWVLALPPGAGPLAEARVGALREELARLGVARIEVGSVPEPPPGKYEAVVVILDPG